MASARAKKESSKAHAHIYTEACMRLGVRVPDCAKSNATCRATPAVAAAALSVVKLPARVAQRGSKQAGRSERATAHSGVS